MEAVFAPAMAVTGRLNRLAKSPRLASIGPPTTAPLNRISSLVSPRALSAAVWTHSVPGPPLRTPLKFVVAVSPPPRSIVDSSAIPLVKENHDQEVDGSLLKHRWLLFFESMKRMP